MPVVMHYEKSRLTACLSGEIDHHSAAALRSQIDQSLMKYRPPTLTLDFLEVTFMDSSAVGLVMGRYKQLGAFGGELEVVNLSPVAYRMMQLSGLQALSKLSQKSLAPEKEREMTRV